MNKSVAVFNLKLPTDILHSICEFIYYNYEDCKKHSREKIKKINVNIQNSYIMLYEYSTGFTIAQYIEDCNIQYQYLICKNCGNYKIIQKGILHKNCICFCNNDPNIQYIQLDENSYEAWYIG